MPWFYKRKLIRASFIFLKRYLTVKLALKYSYLVDRDKYTQASNILKLRHQAVFISLCDNFKQC